MSQSLFDCDDYKAFLLDYIRASPKSGRGFRRKMAEAMGCQVAYVSHVLAGDRHLSLEQAEALTRFLSLRADEAEFFLNLVELSRAGTRELRQLFNRQLEKKRDAYRQIKSRVRLSNNIGPQDQIVYYSSWHYQAVRMLLTIPGFQRSPEISNRLGMTAERTGEVVSFLLSKGLIKETEDGYVSTETLIHLGKESALIGKMHANWRMHTLLNLDRNNPDDLHYSGAVTLSRADYHKVREILLKAVTDGINLVKPSKEERLCAMAVDFYEI